MPHPLVTRAHPKHFLWSACFDLALGLWTAGVWQGVIPLKSPYWNILPAWAWPAATGLLLVSAVYNYWRHVQRERAGR